MIPIKKSKHPSEIIKYHKMLEKVITVLPPEKAEYWLKRIGGCRSLSVRMKLCGDIIDHFGKKEE